MNARRSTSIMLGCLRRQNAYSLVNLVRPVASVKRLRHTYNFTGEERYRPVVLPNGARMVETDVENAIELIEWLGKSFGNGILTTKTELKDTMKNLDAHYTDLSKTKKPDPHLARLLKNWNKLEPLLVLDVDAENKKNPWYIALVYKNLQIAALQPNIPVGESTARTAAAYEWRLRHNIGVGTTGRGKDWLDKGTGTYFRDAQRQLESAVVEGRIFGNYVFFKNFMQGRNVTFAIYAFFGLLFWLFSPFTADLRGSSKTRGPDVQTKGQARRRGELPQQYSLDPDHERKAAEQLQNRNAANYTTSIEQQAMNER